jgi:plastocyanin
MKRSILITLTAVLVVAAGAGYGFARIMVKPPAPITDTGHVIELKDNRAIPSSIAITQGDYVQFNSKDGQAHNIGQGSGNDEVHREKNLDEHNHNYEAKVSGSFGSDEGYRVIFNQAGTYEFHDHLNPSISVAVIVYKE